MCSASKPRGFQALDAGAANGHGFIDGVVQQLDLEFVLRVIEL
jgi:hypothetical protein